jgi:hypothetical protein
LKFGKGDVGREWIDLIHTRPPLTSTLCLILYWIHIYPKQNSTLLRICQKYVRPYLGRLTVLGGDREARRGEASRDGERRSGYGVVIESVDWKLEKSKQTICSTCKTSGVPSISVKHGRMSSVTLIKLGERNETTRGERDQRRDEVEITGGKKTSEI